MAQGSGRLDLSADIRQRRGLSGGSRSKPLEIELGKQKRRMQGSRGLCQEDCAAG